MMAEIIKYINAIIRFINSLANLIGMDDVLTEIGAEEAETTTSAE